MFNNNRNYLTGCGTGMMVSAVVAFASLTVSSFLSETQIQMAILIIILTPPVICFGGLVIGYIGLRGKDNE